MDGGNYPAVKPRRGSRRKRHGKQTPSPEMATRGVSASPQKGRRGGTRGTRAPRARVSPARRQRLRQRSRHLSADPQLGGGGYWGEKWEGAGEERGGQAGGAATLSSHLPKALACNRTPRLIHTHGDSTPEGEVPISASAPDATWRSLPDRPPTTPDPALGRGLRLTARWTPGQTPRSSGRRARRFPSAPARSAPRNSRAANFKAPPSTSKRAGRPTAAASALTIDPLAHSLRRPRRRRGQGPDLGPPLVSQRQPRGPPGPARARGT